MKVAVLDIKGKETSKKVDLNDGIFAIEPNDHAIYLDVKQYQAAQRQGTHKSKERGEVSGSTKKISKQKGSGGARFGSIKSPLLRGGGRVFGPQPRDYDFKLNKKLKRLARKSALSYKAKDNAITILEDFNFDAPKTTQYIELLNNLNLAGKKTLLVLAGYNKNIYLSSRNLQSTRVVTVAELNTYDILNATNLLMVESSIKEVENVLSK
jgi:large subunit ribosomal protein L4